MGAGAIVAVGPSAAGQRALRIANGRIVALAEAAGEAAALAAVGQDAGDVLLRLGQGVPGTVPARACDGIAAFGCLTQDRPADVLDIWARLIVAGHAAGEANWDGVICVAGDGVQFWVHLSAGEIVSFQGFLTPRLIGALGGAGDVDAAALADTMSRPERLAAHLRGAQLAGDARAISGHLIGAELAAARPYWLGQRVVLVAPDGVASPYEGALRAQGGPVSLGEAAALTLAGLRAVRAAG